MKDNVKLGTLGEIFIGLTYRPEDVANEGTIVLRSSNIQNGRLDFDDIVRVKCKVRENLIVKPNDILMCSRNGSAKLVGKCTLLPEMDEEMSFGAFMTIIRTQHNPYLLHFFNSNAFRGQLGSAATTTINQITRKMLNDISVPIYPKEQEESIVTVLNQIDELIRTEIKRLDLLDELVKARFVEMFGDYDLSHTESDWKAISEIGKVVGGATPKTNIEEYWDGEYRWITPAELSADSGYIYDSVRKLTKAGVDSCSLQEMPTGTVILSSRAPIGKVAIAGNTFYCNQGFKNIICGNNVIPRYLYTVLLLNSDYLNSLGRGATFKEISKAIVENIKIPVPPMALQEQFTTFVEQVDKSKFAVQQSLDKLETLKKALMQKYFG